MIAHAHGRATCSRTRIGFGFSAVLGLLLGLQVTAAFAQSCLARLDQKMLRSGTAVMPYSGSDPGVDDSGIRLTFLGYAQGNDRQYTAWSILNSNASEQRVWILALGGGESASGAFVLPPHSETFVRSTITSQPATYSLYNSGGEELAIHVEQPEGTPSWEDERLVDDSLCGEPDAVLWHSAGNGLMGVSTVDASTLITVTTSTSIDTLNQAIAVDEVTGNLWTYRHGHLVAVDKGGDLLLDVATDTETGNLPIWSSRNLAVDGSADNLWLGVGSLLYRLDMAGTVVGSIATAGSIRDIEIDSAHGTVWVATSAGISIVRAGAAASAEPSIVTLADVSISGGTSSAAADPNRGEAWFSTNTAMTRYDAAGVLTFHLPTTQYASLQVLELDANGGAWGSADTRLVHFNAAGAIDAEAILHSEYGTEWVADLATNPATDTVWVRTYGGLLQYSSAGPVDAAFGLSPLTSSVLHAGIMPLLEEPYRLAIFAE